MSLLDLIKPHLPTRLRSQLSKAASFWRGRRVVSAYTAHHRRARRAYRSGNVTAAPPSDVRHGIGVSVLNRAGTRGVIELPHDYLATVQAIRTAAHERFSRSQGLSFFPGLPAGPLPTNTADIEAVKRGEVIIMRLVNPATLPGISDLSRAIVEQLERRVFRSHAVVDRLFVYRSPISAQQPRASWVWHYDNYPREIVKVMIYLSDVTDGTAPFEYLRSRHDGRALRGRPLAPGYGHGRFDDTAIHAFNARGYVAERVVGESGTLVVFDTNVVHRANLAEVGHRDVLVLQVRPALLPGHGVVDERWTGSFQHTGFNPDPADLQVHLECS